MLCITVYQQILKCFHDKVSFSIYFKLKDKNLLLLTNKK